jgi:hypothetical protein
MITFDKFCEEYQKHDKEMPKRVERKFDGYEYHFQNGDCYIQDEQLIPGRTPSSYSGSYMSDDFTYKNTWNGEEITH